MPVGEKTNFEPVPKSTYCLRVEECVERAQKADASKTFFAWTLKVMNDCEEINRDVNILTPKGMNPGSTLEKMWLACGQPELPTGEAFNTDDIVGCEFYAHVTVKTRKGNAGSYNDLETIWSLEDYEKEIAKATTRRPAAQQPAAEDSSDEPETAQQVHRASSTPAQRPASSTPAQRPASTATGPGTARKPLSFPNRAGALNK